MLIKPYSVAKEGDDLVVKVTNTQNAEPGLERLATALGGDVVNESNLITSLLLLKGKGLEDIGYAAPDALSHNINQPETIFHIANMTPEAFDELYEQGERIAKRISTRFKTLGVEVTMPITRMSNSKRALIPTFEVTDYKDWTIPVVRDDLEANDVKADFRERHGQVFIDIPSEVGSDQPFKALLALADKPLEGKPPEGDRGLGRGSDD